MINTYDFKIARPDYFKQFAVRDILFLYYRCPQLEHKVNLFSHYNEIAYTLSGKKMIHHRDKSWLLTEDTSVFVRKTAYSQEKFYEVGWELLAFYFPDRFLVDVFNSYREHLPLHNLPPRPGDMLISISINETTKAFFYSIIPYFSQQVPPTQSLLELKFREMLYNIMSNPENTAFLSYVHSIADNVKTSLQEVMEANYNFNLTLQEFARLTHRSLASFKREFFQLYNETPGRWLTHKRLEYAAYLLQKTQKPISTIAYESGFENVTHFSRVFKEKNGLSPAHYKKKSERHVRKQILT